MAKKIYLSPSDQVSNAYAYGNTNEAIQCRLIADACEVALKRCGFEVRNNKTEGMVARCEESDRWGADLHVPIHTNAYNKSVTGTRIFCYSKSGEGYKASCAVFNALAPVTIGTSENVSENANLYEVRMPNAPTVYIEVDFHDVAAVAKWIIENVEQIGESIAKGICNYYGVKYVEKPIPVKESVMYFVTVGGYPDKKKAEEAVAKIKAAGIPAASIVGIFE